MKDVQLSELLQAGAHFGHQTSRWNPKMRPYIFAVRNNIHIMDLEKTRAKLLEAMVFAREVAAKGGSVLFVGTKRQSKDAVKTAAVACAMPYVITRWLGGTFTNFRTIQKTIKKMERYENLKATGEMDRNYTKKERLMMDRELAKMKNLFEGIKDLRKLPEAIVIFDANYDKIALIEAQKSKVKIIAVVDTNSDPDNIDYIIPANDDAIKSIAYVADAIANAINEGKQAFVPAVAAINAVNANASAGAAANAAPAVVTPTPAATPSAPTPAPEKAE